MRKDVADFIEKRDGYKCHPEVYIHIHIFIYTCIYAYMHALSLHIVCTRCPYLI